MNTETDIHKQIDCLHQALEQRRKELVDQLRQLTQQKLKDLAAQRDQCELVQTQFSSCLDYVEGSLKTGSEGEILAMKIPVLKQIEQITAKFKPSALSPQQEADIQLLTDEVLDLQMSCQGFAEIVAGHSVCCSKSFATGDGLKTATVREEATVTLHARDKNVRECDALLQDVSGSLVCTRDSTTVKCDITREGISTHTVSYQPTTRGRHQLYLKINGKIVKGSPHSVIVKQNFQDLGNPVKVIPGFIEPWGVTTDSKDQIIVTGWKRNHISIFSPEWDKVQLLGCESHTSTVQFHNPTGVTVDDDDNIYIADCSNHRIQKFSSDGRFVASVGTYGSNPLQFAYPLGIGFSKKNGKLYVCDRNNHRIQILETDLTLHRIFGSSGCGNGQFTHPYNVAFDSGDVFVADFNNHRIQVLLQRDST